MRAILYQVAETAEENASRGVPVWVVWALVVIIVLLLVFILVRDKRARNAVKNLFSWIANKIRVVRLKSKIGKREQERSELMEELGRTIWEKNIENPDIEAERQEISYLKNDETSLADRIEKLDREIQQLRERSEKAEKDQEARMAEIEIAKTPLEKQHRELVHEKEKIEDRIKEDEKKGRKTIKSIESHKREIEKIEADGYLSKIEKEMKRKEQEKEIKALENKQPEIQQKLRQSEEDQKKIEKNIDELKGEIKKYDDRLDGLRKEWREVQKKDEDEIGAFQKNRKALSIKRIGIQKQLTSLFENLGEKINRNRIDHGDLKPVYSKIDQLDASIKVLQEKIDKKQK